MAAQLRDDIARHQAEVEQVQRWVEEIRECGGSGLGAAWAVNWTAFGIVRIGTGIVGLGSLGLKFAARLRRRIEERRANE